MRKMLAPKTMPFDPAEHLDDDAATVEYLADALETGDPAFIADALGVVARAKVMGRVSEKAGVSRESLYRTLSDKGNPDLGTVLKALKALGLRLKSTPG